MLNYVDAYLLHTWDHTANICCMLDAVVSVLINSNSTSTRYKPKEAAVFHPYRKKKSAGKVITKKNFKSALKGFADVALMNK